MDKFPLLWEGTSLGELTVEQEPLYTWFTARCRLPGKGIWCAWVVGDKGELRLGVLEPQNGIRRRFSRQMTAPLGSLLRGELRPAGGSAETWTAAAEPDRLFQTPWLRKQLHGARGLSQYTDVERYLRDCQMLTIGEGSSEVCQIVISGKLYHSEPGEY